MFPYASRYSYKRQSSEVFVLIQSSNPSMTHLSPLFIQFAFRDPWVGALPYSRCATSTSPLRSSFSPLGIVVDDRASLTDGLEDMVGVKYVEPMTMSGRSGNSSESSRRPLGFVTSGEGSAMRRDKRMIGSGGVLLTGIRVGPMDKGCLVSLGLSPP